MQHPSLATGFHGFYKGERRRVSAVKDKVYKYFDGIKPEIGCEHLPRFWFKIY
jgi:hypothetical protein